MSLNPNERQDMTAEENFERMHKTARDLFHEVIGPKLLEIREKEDEFFIVRTMFTLGCETIAIAMTMHNEMVGDNKDQTLLLKAIMINIQRSIEGHEQFEREFGSGKFIN